MTPPTDEITTGEVSRSLATLTSTVTDGFKDLAEKVDRRPTWEDVRRIEAGLIERVKKLEGWNAWVVSTFGLLIIGALVALILKPQGGA